MKSIGYYINTFLRRSEGFIYDQVKNISAFSVEIFARSRENAGMFPFENVNCIDSNPNAFIETLLFTISRKSRFLEKTVKDKNISLIHAHFGVDAVYALPVARKLNLPLIITFHGYDITRLPKFTLYPASWLNYYLYFDELKNNGSLFIAVSEFVKKKLLEKGFPEDKVITHYLGVDVNVKPAIPNDEKIILFAGRLVEVKGVEYLILAAADVCKYHPDAKILICGDGPRRKDLEYLAKTKGLTKNVIFPGWKTREELAALMRRARVFVLPSITTRDGRVEGLGMVLLEAMACGLPVIGTNQGGIPEAVLDGENGFIVPEKHSVGLSEKIRLLLDDRALSTRMGNKGRELANDKFDIRKQVAGLEKIYRSMGI